MKLSIIIVNWNVKDLLRKCLSSVYQFGPKEGMEVFVIDNNSQDESVNMVQHEFPQTTLITNTENLGFSKANNQGLEKATGEYILFLNPDMMLHEDTLGKMIAYMDQHADVGIAACTIKNPDGTLQGSIRKFPTLFSQFIKARLFKKDPEKEFDYTREQEVDQLQGAFLLVRKSILDHIGNWDEEFFIWMEDIDLCKRTKDAGHKIVYTPITSVTHARSSSFGQKDLYTRQKWFNKSCIHYYKKHHGKAQALLLQLLSPLSLWAAKRKMDTQKISTWFSTKTWWYALAAIALVEVFSFWGWSVPLVQEIGWYVIVGLTLLITAWRLEYGIMIVLAEMIIGSKGHLFSLSIAGFDLSSRSGIFAAAMAGWFIHTLIKIAKKQHQDTILFRKSSTAKWYILAAIFAVIALAKGYLNGFPITTILLDFNAWPTFALAFLFYDGLRTKEQLTNTLTVIVAALAAQTLKVAGVLYIMSHAAFGYEVMHSIYRWVRDTGVGEVTRVDFNFYRTFWQSQVYLIPLFCVLALTLCVRQTKRLQEKVRALTALKADTKILFALSATIASLLLSLSRSFWIGLAAVCLLWLVMELVRKAKIIILVSTIGRVIIATLGSLILIFAVVNFPLPAADASFGLKSFKDRFNVSDEAAAASRWELLPVLNKAIKERPLGYGFGKEVTYFTKDPRILEENGSGEYTTYAFEWGYHDLIIKLGVFGTLFYLIYLVSITVKGWKKAQNDRKKDTTTEYILTMGVWLGLISLFVIHFFTPYFNHPLGISYILLACLLFERNLWGSNMKPLALPSSDSHE